MESVTLVCEGSESVFRTSGKAEEKEKKNPRAISCLDTRVISEEFGLSPCFACGHILF